MAQQLIAYKRYRQIADLLARREAAGLRTYLRLAPPPKVEGIVDLSGLGLDDLAAAARLILSKSDQRKSLGNVVTAPKVTIREKIQMIALSLRNRGRTTFQALLGHKRSRLDIVVTFLAMLELVKRRFIQANQERLFGDIDVEALKSWEEGEDFDLEFGE